MGPGFPLPIDRPSAFTTGTISAAETGEETFIRDKNIVPRNVGFRELDAKFGGHLKHSQARNSSQRTGRDGRREDLAVFNDEDIISGAFRNVARVIQHKRFIRPARFASIRAITLFK